MRLAVSKRGRDSVRVGAVQDLPADMLVLMPLRPCHIELAPPLGSSTRESHPIVMPILPQQPSVQATVYCFVCHGHRFHSSVEDTGRCPDRNNGAYSESLNLLANK